MSKTPDEKRLKNIDELKIEEQNHESRKRELVIEREHYAQWSKILRLIAAGICLAAVFVFCAGIIASGVCDFNSFAKEILGLWPHNSSVVMVNVSVLGNVSDTEVTCPHSYLPIVVLILKVILVLAGLGTSAFLARSLMKNED
jgi:hypothetical protein